MGKRIEFKQFTDHGEQQAVKPVKTRETIVYRVNITQFELSKLLYESEAFSRIELTASAKLFVWALCSHYNPDNETMFPAQATVAKRLGLSARSAERSVKELKEKGLITYTTKRVNHYVFSPYFFELLGLGSYCKTTILSDDARQNVGSKPRQNVGLTNKGEQKNKKGNFIFFKGVENEKSPSDKVFKHNNWKYQQQQKEIRSTPGVEETRELLEKQKQECEKAVNPIDFTREQALKWLGVADEWFLNHSKIAQHLIKKYSLSEFE